MPPPPGSAGAGAARAGVLAAGRLCGAHGGRAAARLGGADRAGRGPRRSAGLGACSPPPNIKGAPRSPAGHALPWATHTSRAPAPRRGSLNTAPRRAPARVRRQALVALPSFLPDLKAHSGRALQLAGSSWLGPCFSVSVLPDPLIRQAPSVLAECFGNPDQRRQARGLRVDSACMSGVGRPSRRAPRRPTYPASRLLASSWHARASLVWNAAPQPPATAGRDRAVDGEPAHGGQAHRRRAARHGQGAAGQGHARRHAGVAGQRHRGQRGARQDAGAAGRRLRAVQA
jgi:hypothetical protein